MHFLLLINSKAIVFAAFLLAIFVSYITIKSFIKYEFEGNVSRGLYTFTAIFGVLALIGTVVSLTLVICCLA